MKAAVWFWQLRTRELTYCTAVVATPAVPHVAWKYWPVPPVQSHRPRNRVSSESWDGPHDTRLSCQIQVRNDLTVRVLRRLSENPELGDSGPRPIEWPVEHPLTSGRGFLTAVPGECGDQFAGAGKMTVGRARRGASGALYPQSATAGLNSLSRFWRLRTAAQCAMLMVRSSFGGSL